MRISNEKPTVFQEQRLDYAPSLLKQSANENIVEVKKVNKVSSIDKKSDLTKEVKENLDSLSKDINKLSEDKNVYVNFTMDDKTGKKIVQFVDHKTKEVIKQIPSEELLRITQSIDSFLKKYSASFPPGFLINERA